MKPTRATPIISAAAVEAVRFGLRIAFSRANVPLIFMPRCIGQPSTFDAGRANTGASTDTPMKVTRAPRPTRAIAPLDRPLSIEPTPAAVISEPMIGRFRDVPVRSSATERIAAIGGTFAALRAGKYADTSVTVVPTIIEVMTVELV